MGNCKDCRSWDKDLFLCEFVEFVDQRPLSTQKADDADFKIAITVSDDHGLECGLKTGPMFGCVHFQMKSNIILNTGKPFGKLKK